MKIPALSFSSWELFKQCPRQYYHLKVLKDIPYVQGAEAAAGDAIHKTFETALAGGQPVPAGAPGAEYAPVVEAWRSKPGQLFTEWKFALRADGTSTTWFDKTKVALGAIDTFKVDGAVATCADWKAGASKNAVRYAKPEQLDIAALAIMAAHPQVNEVRGRLVFLHHGELVPPNQPHYNTRDQLPALRRTWLIERPAEIQAVADSGAWDPKPSPLCGWCSVKSCPHRPQK